MVGLPDSETSPLEWGADSTHYIAALGGESVKTPAVRINQASSQCGTSP